MAKQILQIMKVDRRAGVGKKSLKAYDMAIAKCNLLDDSGVFIDQGELVLPDAFKDAKPGFYSVETALQSFRGNLEVRVVGLVAVQGTVRKAA
jgi:hypothetical protein